jgi:hypothetical protein
VASDPALESAAAWAMAPGPLDGPGASGGPRRVVSGPGRMARVDRPGASAGPGGPPPRPGGPGPPPLTPSA